ncbi:MAG: hypothetical protein ACR2QM_04590, partial [Longimicrobiales bacterium]
GQHTGGTVASTCGRNVFDLGRRALMLTAYVFCLAVGGGFLALSLFGDALDADVELDGALDVDLGGEIDAGVDIDSDGWDFARFLSLRTLVYALFGFGAVGTLLTLFWSGGRPGITGIVAASTGLLSGFLISQLFHYLRSSDSGTKLDETAFVGLPGRVQLAIAPEAVGSVTVQRGDRRYRLRARVQGSRTGKALAPEQSVVVVGMEGGVAFVEPVDTELMEG